MLKQISSFTRFFIVLISFPAWISAPVSGQTEPAISVAPEVSYRVFDTYHTEKPIFYGLSDAMTSKDVHVLESLSQNERRLIEAEISPPAIGILRNLNSPLQFSMVGAPIPGENEIDYAGGYFQPVRNDTIIWTTQFKSSGADMIRLFFSEGYFPSGVKINIFSEHNFALTLHDLQGQLNDYGFYTPSAFSDRLTLQVLIAPGSFRDSLRFVIPSLIHADNRYIEQTDNSVPCQEDVNCTYANGYTNIQALKGSTARLFFLVGSLYYFCSGGLVNDSRTQDYQPFLLTANHCFSTQASANSLESLFDYYTTSCNGSNNSNYVTVTGSNLIKTNSQSDFTLVLLKQYPTSDYNDRWYLGWNTGSVANSATLHSVHHPAGVRQRYSRHQNKTSPAFNCGTTHFHHTTTLGGGFEGGSSGSTIVNESGQIVGQLYGKCYSGTFDDCTFSTYNGIWGKFSSSYGNNNLAYWLNNGGSSVSMTNSPASSLSFGTVNVGTTSTLNVTITNNGTVPNYLNLDAGTVTISGTSAGDFSLGGATSLYLSPGQSGTIAVRFSPTSAGAKTAVLNIPHNANNIASPRTLSLTGTGISVCKTCPDYDVAITPAETWSTHSATIPNSGCTIYRVNVTEGLTYTFQTGCGNEATANFDTYFTLFGQSCTVLMANDDGCESNRSWLVICGEQMSVLLRTGNHGVVSGL